jgi:4'-phosphopantetheinyl transferase EntD
LALNDVNPARNSPRIAGLFPAGCAAAELHAPGDPSLLHPEEAACLGRAVPTRVAEFAAGRLCARRALAEFGIVDFALRVGGDREPLWPPALTGSIAHTHGFCVGVVGERRLFRGLGVDSELAGGVHEGLWAKICVPAELTWIRARPDAERAAAATLLFACKEAFYKAQFPLLRERPGFHDVRIEADWSMRGEFQVVPERPRALSEKIAAPYVGRYLRHEALVSAGIAFAA